MHVSPPAMRTQAPIPGHSARRAFAAALALAAVLFPHAARCQDTKIEVVLSSPPSPVGAGARATGEGSAFIATADDATAASWNPAGLIQLERPEVSVAVTQTYHVDSFGTLEEQTPQADKSLDVGTDSFQKVGLNYASATFPFSLWGRNVVVSLNYQQKLSFDRKLTFDVESTTLPSGDRVQVAAHFKQEGGVDAFSPAVAAEITPDLSIGATLSYWFDGLGHTFAWRARNEQSSVIQVGGTTIANHNLEVNTFDDFQGVNGTVGLLWGFYRGFSLGGVVNIPFRARLDFKSVTEDLNTGASGSSRQKLTMDLPISWGLGLSWRVRDRFVASADVTRVEWGDFRMTDEQGHQSLVTGDPAGESEVDGVTTVRAGAEYLMILKYAILALRAGAFYDPEPSRGAPADFYGVSVGLGATRPSFSVDFAYQFRFGLDVSDVSVLNQIATIPTEHVDIFQHFFYLSTVYYL